MYKNGIKILLDFLVALVAFFCLLPVFFLLVILLSIANNGKPFFFQKRPGKNERLFTIIKFKTMNDRTDKNGVLLADRERLTAVGKFVRATSLDEIPQLLNVLWGDMSLVGPRPLLPEYLPLYNDFQKQRHLVKPGITGYAQVKGRNAISWEEKLRLDVLYVERISFLLDVKIILETIKKVVAREGIQAANEATTTHFKGNIK
ncbi:MAG: sugar transferase [Altibacter sp.]|uniref:sugar transferase n=1 Tax=Altibacter sp. TaxID=2024823 RepID=UPI001E0FE8BA|nr:sugar transferase [Altibacter sp.]MBZ0327467.1 sugar transferase [Altibacter sp.]